MAALYVSGHSRIITMHKYFQILVFCLASCSPAVGLRSQALQIDQSNNSPTHFFFSLLSTQPMGQEFVPSFTSLNEVDLMTYGSDGNVTATFLMKIHSGSLAAPVIGVSNEAFRNDGTGLPALSAFSFNTPVALTPGNPYVMEVDLTSGIPAWWAIGYSPTNMYSSGRMILGGTPMSQYDLWFQEGSVVPEPSAISVSLAGVLTVLLFGRRFAR